MTNTEFRFLCRDQAAEIGLTDGEVVLEPAMRDTAPAALIAALTFEATPEALLLIVPSDRMIRDPAGFAAAVRGGVAAAGGGALVAFTAGPDRHDTGILLARAGDLLAVVTAQAPDLVVPCRAALTKATRDLEFLQLDPAAFAAVPAMVLDVALAGVAAGIVSLPLVDECLEFGSWDQIRSHGAGGADGVAASGPVTAIDCRDSLLQSEEAGIHLVGFGLTGIAAVVLRDAVLVADIRRAPEMHAVVTALKRAGVPQAEDYPRFHRPWGWYETLCLGDRFQVKRIMVKPGGILSLQSHFHRAEHWVVVSGTARVTVGEEVKLLTENQSVYVPLGAIHRMENPGTVPMVLIEVQSGTYLGEDDIRRYEDVYNRG